MKLTPKTRNHVVTIVKLIIPDVQTMRLRAVKSYVCIGKSWPHKTRDVDACKVEVITPTTISPTTEKKLARLIKRETGLHAIIHVEYSTPPVTYVSRWSYPGEFVTQGIPRPTSVQ